MERSDQDVARLVKDFEGKERVRDRRGERLLWSLGGSECNETSEQPYSTGVARRGSKSEMFVRILREKAHKTRLFIEFEIALNKAYLYPMKMRQSLEDTHSREKRRERNKLEKRKKNAQAMTEEKSC